MVGEKRPGNLDEEKVVCFKRSLLSFCSGCYTALVEPVKLGTPMHVEIGWGALARGRPLYVTFSYCPDENRNRKGRQYLAALQLQAITLRIYILTYLIKPQNPTTANAQCC
eukprot:scaffold2632_cov136-Skeletonema_dohrnii-CCMP3373.AAC.10